jgi:predicted outer membrane repeat protein
MSHVNFGLLVALCVLVRGVLGGNVFVSSSGNDSATCGSTAALACRSIPFAANISRPNDVILLAAETFVLDETVKIAHNLTFSGSGDTLATVVRGSAAGLLFFEVAPNSTAQDVAFRGVVFDGDDLNRAFVSLSRLSLSSLSFGECEFVRFDAQAVFVSAAVGGRDFSLLLSDVSVRNMSYEYESSRAFLEFQLRDVVANVTVTRARFSHVWTSCPLISLDLGTASVSISDLQLTNLTALETEPLIFVQGAVFSLDVSGVRASELRDATSSTSTVLENHATFLLSRVTAGNASFTFRNNKFRNVDITPFAVYKNPNATISLDVLVADSIFKNDRPTTAACVSWFVLFGSNLGHTSLQFVNTHFEVSEENVCNSALSGGAIFAVFDAADESVSNTVAVRNCTFIKMRAGTGGAIQIDRGSSCTQLSVSGSRFESNSALFSGGAISVSGKVAAHCHNLEMWGLSPVFVTDSIFVGNRAEAGGAIDCSFAGNFATLGDSALVIRNSTFSNNLGLAGGDHLLVGVLRSLNVTNSIFQGGLEPISAVAGFGIGSGHLHFNSSSVSCDVGHFLSIEHDIILASNQVHAGSSLHVSCNGCQGGTYNLGGQTATFGEDGSLLTPIGAATGCFACPAGSRFNCSGAVVGSAPDFWATANATQVVEFLQCPPHYCCADERGCAAIDACANNRSGVLCGACADGFVAGVAFHDKCIPLTDCTSTRFGVASLVFLLGTAALTFYYFASNPKGSGIASVLLSFFNTATLLTAELARARKEPVSSFRAGFSSVVSLASGFLVPLGDSTSVCLTPTLSSLERLTIPLAVTLAMLCWHCLFSVVLALARRRRARTEAIPLNADDEIVGVVEPARGSVLLRVFSSLLMVLNFNLFIVVRVLVDLLVTVDVPGLGCRLWRAGDQSCGGWQTGVGLALAATLLFPLLSELAVRWRKESLLARAVLLVFRSPAADGAGAQSYHLASTVRRAVLALAASFITNVELRLAAIRTILLVAAAWLAFVDTPFKSALVNRLEKTALLVALGVALTLSGESEPNDVLRGFQIAALVLMIFVLLAAMAVTTIRTRWKNSKRKK